MCGSLIARLRYVLCHVKMYIKRCINLCSINSNPLSTLKKTGTPQDLKNLVEFWVGWTSLPQELYVEVTSDVRMPTASTCRETLKLPLHYSHYGECSSDLKAAVSSNSFGFGLV